MNNITKGEALKDAYDYILDYRIPKKDAKTVNEKSVIKTKTKLEDSIPSKGIVEYKENPDFDLLDNIFLHKQTKYKVELAVFIELDKRRKNIDAVYKNMDKILELSSQEQIDLIQNALYLSKEYEQGSTTILTEGKKKFIKFKKKSFLVRVYKCVGTSWAKIEITGVLGKRTDKLKLVNTMEKCIKRAIKGSKHSTKTYRFQAGTEFDPLNHYYKIEDYKNL